MQGIENPAIACAVDANVRVVEIGSTEGGAIDDGVGGMQSANGKVLLSTEYGLAEALRVGFAVEDDGAIRTEHPVFLCARLRRTRRDEEKIGRETGYGGHAAGAEASNGFRFALPRDHLQAVLRSGSSEHADLTFIEEDGRHDVAG